MSPNGHLVAAMAIEGPRALIVYCSAGGRAAFFDLSRVAAVPLAWSPDSRYLAVGLSGYAATSTNAANPFEALLVIDTRTGTARKIADGYAAGASFAPDRADRLVYGLGRSSSITGRLNLYTANPDGSAITQLTHDGHSLNPVWGARGIAFDRELRRFKYQIFMRTARHTTQITHLRLSSQDQGLIPAAVSANGTRLVTRFQSFGHSGAWTVDLADDRVRELPPRLTALTSLSISRDGRSVLVGTLHTVTTIPFLGRGTTVLVKHASQPSWNQ